LFTLNENQEEGIYLFNGVLNKSSLHGRDRSQSRELGVNDKSVRETVETAVVDNEQGRYQGCGLAADIESSCTL
jgi:hypothetical protein